MLMTQGEKDCLTGFCATQTALQPRGSNIASPRIDLGAMLDTMQADDRLQSLTIPFTLPAPAGAAATKDFIAFKAPGDGQIVSVEIIPNAAWGAGNNVGDTYLASVHRYNNTPADVAFAHDLVTGLAAGASARLPTGSSNALLTSGQNLTVTVSGSAITLTNAVAWVAQPNIGDYVSITSAATGFAGATPSNPGVYVVTAATSLTLTATKVSGHDPEAVSVASAGAGDVAGVRLIRVQEAAFAAGDVIGVRVIVPISTSTPVDVSALALAAIIKYKTTA